MKGAGLRTICSVSGTTTDIVAGLHAHIGGAKTKAMLDSLKQFVDGGCSDPTKLSDDFKNLFLSIAMYMQSGQYHSAAEVLGGLYCAAITLSPDGNDPKDFDQIAPKFRIMWTHLQSNPENFFPLSQSDRDKLNEQTPGIIKGLQRQHNQTIAGRKEQGMETLETLREAREAKENPDVVAERKSLEKALLKTPQEQEEEEQKFHDDFMSDPKIQDALNRKRSREAP
jgi:hypothetical protein